MIDLVNALTTGATVAGALRGLTALENLLGRRNGNGKHSPNDGFTLTDHDALQSVKNGLDLLHEDLVEMRQDLRDCIHGRRY